ncbi:hypothetical protein O181_079716 [Austropuccinia psidii MF-1]|uniref:Uncharacterized protein n=1 Tax=Austropuccinia psidii MF-1 TaxID=1389203 RepID=A0A9Q3FGS9_9BASI|nr:hypothetical protein [Austropuccinia psidii MF-1]
MKIVIQSPIYTILEESKSAAVEGTLETAATQITTLPPLPYPNNTGVHFIKSPTSADTGTNVSLPCHIVSGASQVVHRANGQATLKTRIVTCN